MSGSKHNGSKWSPNTLFLSIDISFSIKEEEVHAIGELEGEATLAWQTCVSMLIFNFLFSFRQTSKSFEIKSILFFKESFSFTTKSSFEDKISFYFKTISNHFYSLEFIFF